MIGSGRCGEHNVKLVRLITQKKMSIIDKTGKISWKLRDVTTLSCPVAGRTSDLPDSQISVEMPNPPELSTANNKRIKISDSKVDQSTERIPE